MDESGFVPISVRLDEEEFQRLPRHPAYLYAYRNGRAELTPQAVLRNCRIATGLSSTPPAGTCLASSPFSLQKLHGFDPVPLAALFREAFAETIPYSTLTPAQLDQAVQHHFVQALNERPWPVVWEASQVIVDQQTDRPVGVGLMTLIPAGNWTDFTDPVWQQIPPENPLKTNWGRPHFSWLFVSPRFQRHGLATILLTKARSVLHQMGYENLFSTVLVGDHASTLWHWRQGFELLPWK